MMDKTEAVVTAVETHPKQPGMYRVAIRFGGDNEKGITGAAADDIDAAFDVPASEMTAADWHGEVDALIAGAAAATAAERGETVLTVHEDTLVSLRLLKGRKLSAEEWDSLQREERQEEAYRAALNILERKARTSRELADALKRKGYEADVVRGCLDRLQARRMLDDPAYARRFAEQRATGHRKGSRLIRQELLQRGIAKEDAEQALRSIDSRVEQEAALALARKKWPQLKGEPRERKMKLAAFLLRRGYPGGVAKAAVDRVVAEAESEERYAADDHETDFGEWPSFDSGAPDEDGG